MKQAILSFSVVVWISFFSTVSMAADRMEINDAFKKGLISLTFTGRDKGERVEIKAKKRSSKAIILLINKGETNIANMVSFNTGKTVVLDLSKKDDATIVLPQTGSHRIIVGSETLEANPPK
ncbi:MAG: hypothetical protein HGA59_06575 [Chlorobiaceae bacterium]|jgi:hypothetical protein|nr:hypothetical protein [Chlorobiaceae bacterium]NTV15826.1 hypothetical protein [Chlorobiaceae bacterium]